jgi:hypothetical protein
LIQAQLLRKDAAMTDRNTVVGVFSDRTQAQQAMQELRIAGFRDDQLGLAASGDSDFSTAAADESDTYAAEGGTAGLAAGAGVGALWGLGIAAGVMPAIGPAIAGGTLAAILSSAAAGAATAGLAGTLVGLGIPKEEAEYYEGELRSGRIILTVHTEGRNAEARAIQRRFGGYDASDCGETRRVDIASPVAPSAREGMSAPRSVKVPVSGRDVAGGNIAGTAPGSPTVPPPARACSTRRDQGNCL